LHILTYRKQSKNLREGTWTRHTNINEPNAWEVWG